MALNLSAKSKKLFDKQIIDFHRNVEKSIIYRMEFVVADLVNHAKANAEYNFISGNLNSSIGGAVYNNGKLITYKSFSGKSEGVQGGIEYLNSITVKSTGYTIVIVAGMEYASVVENYYNKNVLKRTELIAGKEVQFAFKYIKKDVE